MTLALEADNVYSFETDSVTVTCAEIRNVTIDPRCTTDVSTFPESYKLRNTRVTTNDHAVTDVHVAGKVYGVGKSNIVTEGAIVSDVTVGHEETVRTDDGFIVLLGCPAVNRDVFAESIVVPDDGFGRFVFIRIILRRSTDGTELEELISLADRRVTIDDDIRMEFAVIADRDISTDHTERTDFDIIPDLRLRMDE